MKSIVIGLGGMGSAAAAHLASRGVEVVGIERFTPAHDRGSSHGRSRIIRQAYFEGAQYVPLLLRAYELWQQLDPSLLNLTGGLMIGAPDSDVFAGSLASAREHGLAHEVLDATEIRRAFRSSLRASISSRCTRRTPALSIPSGARSRISIAPRGTARSCISKSPCCRGVRHRAACA